MSCHESERTQAVGLKVPLNVIAQNMTRRLLAARMPDHSRVADLSDFSLEAYVCCNSAMRSKSMTYTTCGFWRSGHFQYNYIKFVPNRLNDHKPESTEFRNVQQFAIVMLLNPNNT
eukprot:2580106-Amphidinium_carterae.2